MFRHVVFVLVLLISEVNGFHLVHSSIERRQGFALNGAKAGTFFNTVPDDDDDSDDELPRITNDDITDLLRSRKQPSLASKPSTINGVPTSAKGFGRPPAATKTTKPYIAIGPPDTNITSINDPTKPEYDDQGYTLYHDEKTGTKARVFEALVKYPCQFTLKIVGVSEGLFAQEMVAVVAESCRVQVKDIAHSVRINGKWTSVTVKAPVASAEMLYALYENVDRDPRVKFKF
jgi:putative lipoic acid-binding regulatory protein